MLASKAAGRNQFALYRVGIAQAGGALFVRPLTSGQ
jgi:hypothetical protein